MKALDQIFHSRRKFLRTTSYLLGAFCLLACKGEVYVRPARTDRLGAIKEFLYKKVFLREKQVLVHRVENGWKALSTKCTKKGCDLTFQKQVLVCSCCESVYDHYGRVLRGSAPKNLPWLKLEARGDDFYLDSGVVVSEQEFSSSEEIEKIIKQYNFEFKEIDDVDLENVQLPEVFKVEE